MRGDHLGVSANPALVRFSFISRRARARSPRGRKCQTFETLEWVCEQLASLNVSRADVVVGVGGGAITDLAGFAAAVYLRGVRLIQVPTTLVARWTRRSGKDCRESGGGKEPRGCLPPAVTVLCDYETLETLPERERLSGMGEVAKCWLLDGLHANDLLGLLSRN